MIKEIQPVNRDKAHEWEAQQYKKMVKKQVKSFKEYILQDGGQADGVERHIKHVDVWV